MGFISQGGGGSGEEGPPGPPGPTGPAGPLATSQTTAWTNLTVSAPGATGTVRYRTQLAGQTLQLQGSLTFAPGLDANTLLGTMAGVTVPQTMVVPAAATVSGAPGLVGLNIATGGPISLIIIGTAVTQIWFANDVPLS